MFRSCRLPCKVTFTHTARFFTKCLYWYFILIASVYLPWKCPISTYSSVIICTVYPHCFRLPPRKATFPWTLLSPVGHHPLPSIWNRTRLLCIYVQLRYSAQQAKKNNQAGNYSQIAHTVIMAHSIYTSSPSHLFLINPAKCGESKPRLCENRGNTPILSFMHFQGICGCDLKDIIYQPKVNSFVLKMLSLRALLSPCSTLQFPSFTNFFHLTSHLTLLFPLLYISVKAVPISPLMSLFLDLQLFFWPNVFVWACKWESEAGCLSEFRHPSCQSCIGNPGKEEY